MRVAILAWAALILAGCATAPMGEFERLQEAPVRFMAMAPIEEAAKGGRTVVRLFTADEDFWPVVEFVAEPGGGVTVTAVNTPDSFGATRITAPVDPEIWKLAVEDFATLKAETGAGDRMVIVDLGSGAMEQTVTAGMVCKPKSWFVVADRSGVSAPGMGPWGSCGNRQGEALPGFYGLALHSLAPCNALEPQVLDVTAISRCLRISGVKEPAVELSNLIVAERETLLAGSDDLPLIRAHFGPESRFSPSGGEARRGREGLTAGWGNMAPGRRLRIGLSAYHGLSATEVEVKGEAFYVIDADASGRQLALADREMWFAPYRQIWAKTPDGWVVREFVIEPLARAHGANPLQRFLAGRG